MAQLRKALPQLGGEFFLTDGGIETLIFSRPGITGLCGLSPAEDRGRRGRTAQVLSNLRGPGAAVRHRTHSRKCDVACKRGLGHQAGLQRQRDS